MIYKFKSKATGDVIMLGPHGDQLLRLAGREPAPQGVFEVEAMPAALRAWEQAIAADPASGAGAEGEADDPAGKGDVALRQRLWPMIEMLRRAHDAGERVVWGV